MKTLTNSFFKLSILATILLAVLTVQYIQAAPWSGPPAGTAPQNNVDAPIHEGTDAQVKNGPLSVDGLTSFSNTNSFIGAGSQEFHIKPGFKGDVQTVGYTTIGTTSSTLYVLGNLEVEGTSGTDSEYLWRYENFDEDEYEYVKYFEEGQYGRGFVSLSMPPGTNYDDWRSGAVFNDRDTCPPHGTGSYQQDGAVQYTCEVDASLTCNDVKRICDHSGEPCGYAEREVICKASRSPYILE